MLNQIALQSLVKLTLAISCFLTFSDSFAAENLTKQQRVIENFSQVEITGGSQLFLKQGNQESLTIEADPTILSQIDSTIKNSKLHLGPKDNSNNINKTVNYYLTLKNIESIKSSGETQIISQGKITSEKLSLALEGSGKIDIKVNVTEMINIIHGSGNIKIQGNAKNQNVTIEGAGVFQGDKFETNTSTIAIKGSGTAIVKVKNELHVNIEGYGKVQYYGNPKITQQISGAGEIIPLG